MAEPGLSLGPAGEALLAGALGLIMFGMGLTLTGDDFRRVGRQPRAVAIGMAAQVLLLPVMAIGVAAAFLSWFGWGEALALGLLLLACCPGGVMSNLYAYLARADIALSVTLTSLSSLASAATTPLFFFATTGLLFGSSSLVQVSIAGMALFVLATIVAPVAVGMAVRAKRPGFARRSERPFRSASVLFLLAVTAFILYANLDTLWTLLVLSVPAATVLCLLALAAGYAAGRFTRLGEPQARALSFQVGFQNGGLGITLALTQLGSAQAAIVPGAYGLLALVIGLPIAFRWGRSAGRGPAADGARE